MNYTCPVCGKTHDGLPDAAFRAPIYYDCMPEGERSSHASLTSELCTIYDEDFFVRGCLAIPIKTTSEVFSWGVWVSLGRGDFSRYSELLAEKLPPGEGPWLGWLSNQIPGYPDTLSLKAKVFLRELGQRPGIELEPTDHPLAVHQRVGISLDELLAILGPELHR